jgi:hypothetical protein
MKQMAGCKQGFKVKVLTRTVLSILKAADRDTECRLLLWMDTNRGLLLRLLSGIWRIDILSGHDDQDIDSSCYVHILSHRQDCR